jgi:hypothetical protein
MPCHPPVCFCLPAAARLYDGGCPTRRARYQGRTGHGHNADTLPRHRHRTRWRPVGWQLSHAGASSACCRAPPRLARRGSRVVTHTPNNPAAHHRLPGRRTVGASPPLHPPAEARPPDALATGPAGARTGRGRDAKSTTWPHASARRPSDGHRGAHLRSGRLPSAHPCHPTGSLRPCRSHATRLPEVGTVGITARSHGQRRARAYAGPVGQAAMARTPQATSSPGSPGAAPTPGSLCDSTPLVHEGQMMLA